jgi:hypothetical protein
MTHLSKYFNQQFFAALRANKLFLALKKDYRGSGKERQVFYVFCYYLKIITQHICSFVIYRKKQHISLKFWVNLVKFKTSGVGCSIMSMLDLAQNWVTEI